jgi:hypothetical protein
MPCWDDADDADSLLATLVAALLQHLPPAGDVRLHTAAVTAALADAAEAAVVKQTEAAAAAVVKQTEAAAAAVVKQTEAAEAAGEQVGDQPEAAATAAGTLPL